MSCFTASITRSAGRVADVSEKVFFITYRNCGASRHRGRRGRCGRRPVMVAFLADAVLTLHVAVVVFVVGGLLAVWVGHAAGWRWVDALWFRLAHLAAIGVVAAQAVAGIACPLTVLEMWLRRLAGQPAYAESFIGHWLQTLLYFDLPGWCFTVLYTGFAGVVMATWWWFPPRRWGRPPREKADA